MLSRCTWSDAYTGRTSTKTLNCDIVPQKTNGFVGGKRYKVEIAENAINVKDASTDNSWISNIPDGKLLWIGTSIPYGYGASTSYPTLIEEAIKKYKSDFQIINNSKPASHICYDVNEPEKSWRTVDDVERGVTFGCCLSATYEEVEVKYADIIETIAKDNYPADQVEWVVNYMMDNYFKPYSYESLILPHINECSTIIIDHGYKDRLNIVHECLGYPNVNGVLPSGTSWLKELINGGEYKDAFGMGKY